ncbi:unnamed protein product [Arabidopsis arenosa]|uniref:Ubiquitin-like domain-containing protein n=1 Tax=Arabidopsis arenosa TaxID=38785 RepID=A0A8S2AVW8_ARAAE|nr:unnamed protein product [Arabidopsis arenosa]
MKFLVEILGGSSFEIEVDRKDTLLKVKQKIEKSQRIPVSKQTLIVDGIFILREDLNVEQCQIVHDSQIQLEVSADENTNQNGNDQMPETEQSPAPWISVEEYFERQATRMIIKCFIKQSNLHRQTHSKRLLTFKIRL